MIYVVWQTVRVDSLVLKFDTRWRYVARFTPWPFHSREDLPASLNRRPNGPHKRDVLDKNLYHVRESNNSSVL